MSFLHSWMILWFLPLAALPILLHLLTLHRLKTVELPTFRFLFDSYVQQRRRMQFLEALLAMLRALFILALVFLVSRPVVKNWDRLFGATGGGSGGREVILLIDGSASMNARTAGVSAFDRAKSAALAVVKRLRRDDKLTLVRVGARPEEVFSRFNTDTQGILDTIEAMKPGSSRANLFAAFLQLFGPEASMRANPAVYLFTDCQANSWKEATSQGLDRLIPDGTPFTIVNVGATDPLPNYAVVGDAPRRNRAIAGLPFVLRPRVVNFSKTDKAELTLSVLIDEKEVARHAIAVPPGQAVVRPVVYLPTEPGLRRGRFQITGKAPDRFPDDDSFLFTLAVEPRIKVVLVNGRADPDPEKDEARYLHTALTSRAEVAAEEKKPAGQPSTKEILRSLDVRELPEAGLTADTLRDASVVVLANCGGLTDAQFGWLRGFVRDGGGLLVFPGDRVNPTRYNAAFFPVPGPQGERLTDAALDTPKGDPEKLETFESVTVDVNHPALSVFDNPDPDARHFQTVRVYRRFGIVLPKKKGNAWPLARFAGAKAPALVESRHGDGTVILSAFPAHPRWGNLPLKPDFVPLVLRLVSHAEHRPEAEVPPVVVADGTAEVSVSAVWAPAEATVTDPAGASFPLTLERSGARLLGAFEQTGKRGYYSVKVVSGRLDRIKNAELAFAVNLAPEESDFTLLGEKELRSRLPKGVPLTFVDASAAAQEQLGGLGKEREMWPILIWLAFAVIGVEFCLATLSGRRREADEGATVAERVLSASTGAWVGRMTGAPDKAEPGT
jgi:hypothetical protein